MGKTQSCDVKLIFSVPFAVTVDGNEKCGDNAWSTTITDRTASRITRFTASVVVDDTVNLYINNIKYNYDNFDCERLYFDEIGRAHLKCTFADVLDTSSDILDLKIDVVNTSISPLCGLFGGQITFYYD